jgi:hypothetical protein
MGTFESGLSKLEDAKEEVNILLVHHGLAGGGEAVIDQKNRLSKFGEDSLITGPWRNVGLTGFVARDCHGTGTLVFPNLVLTCAHNIVSRRFGKSRKDGLKDCLAKHLRFYIGQSGELHDDYEVESYFLLGEFKGQPKSAEHYDALLKLKPRVPCTKLMPLCFDYPFLVWSSKQVPFAIQWQTLSRLFQ